MKHSEAAARQNTWREVCEDPMYPSDLLKCVGKDLGRPGLQRDYLL